MNPRASEDAIRAWAAARHLPESHLARWLALAAGDRAALLETAAALRMRAGRFIAAFDLIDEISVREAAPAQAILARAELRRILDGAGSAPGRASALLAALRVMRYPRLARTTDRIAREIAALGLPRGIRVSAPRELESDEMKIELAAHGGEELRELIEALARRAGDLARIAELAGGSGWTDDEV